MKQLTVWKFDVDIDDFEIQQVPGGDDARIVHVDRSHMPERVTMWVEVPVGHKPEPKPILIVGTGHYIDKPELWQHVGTVVYPEFPLVWHVYETKET